VSVSDVAKAWTARTERVRTLRFSWNDRYTVARGAALSPPADGLKDRDNPRNLTVPEKTTTYDTSYSVTIAGDGVRYHHEHMHLSFQQELVLQERDWLYSADGFKQFEPPGGADYPRGSLMSVRGMESRPPANIPHLIPVMMAYRPFHPAMSYLTNFTKRFHVVPGHYTAQDRQCVLLREEPETPTGLGTSLFVDPERDFVVMARTVESRNGEQYRLSFHEYTKCDGEWAPLRWTTTFFGAQGSVSTDGASTVAEFSLNEPVEPSEMDVEFPAGTWVTEWDTGEMYILKEGGAKRRITTQELVAGATYDQLLRSETGGISFSPNDNGRPSGKALVAVTLAFGLVGLAWIIRRRHAASRAQPSAGIASRR
jgi:hypothetical protein